MSAEAPPTPSTPGGLPADVDADEWAARSAEASAAHDGSTVAPHPRQAAEYDHTAPADVAGSEPVPMAPADSTQAPAAAAALAANASPFRKVGIIGYTPTRTQAPYGDPEWSLWGMNDLHTQAGVDPSRFAAWFDLHDDATITGNAEHLAWLKGGAAGLPVFVWRPRPEWPTAVAYPRDDITGNFGGYFTNSVSWMIALAITEVMAHSTDGRAPEGAEIGVWGVDMAQGGEYAAQRPSCEYFLGVAAGLGFQVTVPETSDLLKCAGLYGADTGAEALRARLEERNAQLRQTLAEHQATERHHHDAAMQIIGAIENNTYVLDVWTQPHASQRKEAT